jgi:hypothetical protein
MDLWLTLEGDLALDEETGDLRLSSADDQWIQQVIFRLKTTRGDYPLEPQCGASLESVIGKESNRTLASLVKFDVEEALSHDGFMLPGTFNVEVFPVNATEMVVTIQRLTPDEDAFTPTIIAGLSLNEGFIFARPLAPGNNLENIG